MKISKEELKVIYEKERGRVTFKQIDRFKDEEYGQSAFHTYVDGEKIYIPKTEQGSTI